jgi:Flp pilus assembly protein TadD
LTHASVFKIGVALDAGQVIYGSYEVLPGEPGNTQSKGSLRINARILYIRETRQGPALSQVGALEDLAALQTHLGWQVLEQLRPKSAPSEQEFLKARPSVRLDAVESYVRALLSANPEQRQRLFAQAARLDEHYSQPCFQLGKLYWEHKDYRQAAGWLDRVAKSDPHYLEAQFFLGLCKYQTGDFAAAEHCFRTVSTAIPLNEAFNNLGVAEARRHDTVGAMANFQKALEGDNSDPDFHFNLGYTQWRAGQFSEAVESLRAATARNPADQEATALLGRALKHEGPRPGESRFDDRERLKTNYDESAYRQLQAELKK